MTILKSCLPVPVCQSLVLFQWGREGSEPQLLQMLKSQFFLSIPHYSLLVIQAFQISALNFLTVLSKSGYKQTLQNKRFYLQWGIAASKVSCMFISVIVLSTLFILTAQTVSEHTSTVPGAEAEIGALQLCQSCTAMKLMWLYLQIDLVNCSSECHVNLSALSEVAAGFLLHSAQQRRYALSVFFRIFLKVNLAQIKLELFTVGIISHCIQCNVLF